MFAKIGLLAVALAVGVLTLSTRAASSHPEGPFGFTTASITFQGSRTALLVVQNKADEPILTRLQFVDKDGKVLTWQDETIKPGENGKLEFPGFNGGVSVGEFRAQFGTNEKRSIGLLYPRLDIVELQTGSTVKTIGREGFKSFTPDFQPPLK